jgi:hypothetical protein
VETGNLDTHAANNLEALLELRNSVVHFCHRSPLFAPRLLKLAAACIENFVAAVQDWFDRDLSGEMPLYLMPLAVVGLPDRAEAAVLARRRRSFCSSWRHWHLNTMTQHRAMR